MTIGDNGILELYLTEHALKPRENPSRLLNIENIGFENIPYTIAFSNDERYVSIASNSYLSIAKIDCIEHFFDPKFEIENNFKKTVI